MKTTTNAALAESYLDWLANHKRRSPATVYKYRQTYVSLLTWITSERKSKALAEASTADLEAWLRRPRERVSAPSDATIKLEIMAVRSLFKWLHSRGFLGPSDPTVQLLEEAPTVHNEHPNPVPVDWWQKVWASDLTDDMRVALGLGYFCGLRRSSIVSLRPDQFVEVPAPTIINVPVKGGRTLPPLHWMTAVELYAVRLRPLIVDPEWFVAPLRRLLAARAGALALLPWADERKLQYVTRTIHDTPEGFVQPDLMNKRLAKLLKSLGGVGHEFSPHSLRHSFCTNLIDAGVPIEIVSRLAGHSSIQITMRYVRIAEDPLAAYTDPSSIPTNSQLRHYGRWG